MHYELIEDWKSSYIQTQYSILNLCVGATRLERATAWSQTRNATNCATPRLLPFPESDCKDTINKLKIKD